MIITLTIKAEVSRNEDGEVSPKADLIDELVSVIEGGDPGEILDYTIDNWEVSGK